MRLFVAIELGEANRSRLARLQGSLERKCRGVRWVQEHQLHMTVKFLGDVPDGQVPDVSAALELAASSGKPFTMDLQGAGCFPTRGPVRIVWSGATETSGALTQCVAAVEDELESLGFPRERRPFSPHITIGRVRFDDSDGRIRSAVNAAAYENMVQAVKSLTLMSSALSPKGPAYSVVSRANLG